MKLWHKLFVLVITFWATPLILRGPRYYFTFTRYARDYKPGLTRKEVERRLQAHGVRYFRRSGSGTSWSDMVQVGEYPAPLGCSAWPVYVEMPFDRTEPPHDWPIPEAGDSDLLRKVELTSNGDGCL